MWCADGYFTHNGTDFRNRFQADQKKIEVLVCAFSFFGKLCIESACRCDLVENTYGWVEKLWMTF